MSQLHRLLVLALVFCGGVISACAAKPDLAQAEFFALGGIYEEGRMSDGERALRAVLRQPDAAARLQRMLSYASPAGRLYALLGLRLRDRAAYARALQSLPPNDAQVEVMRGCILRSESFRMLVAEIQRGKYDSPSLSHPAW